MSNAPLFGSTTSADFIKPAKTAEGREIQMQSKFGQTAHQHCAGCRFLQLQHTTNGDYVKCELFAITFHTKPMWRVAADACGRWEPKERKV